jgi:ssDNA-specific exonuclease RecJ
MAIYITQQKKDLLDMPGIGDRDQFVRLAEAMLMSRYKFKPQRRAIAAKMYIKWLERKKH